jgi:hypothetical protein
MIAIVVACFLSLLGQVLFQRLHYAQALADVKGLTDDARMELKQIVKDEQEVRRHEFASLDRKLDLILLRIKE